MPNKPSLCMREYGRISQKDPKVQEEKCRVCEQLRSPDKITKISPKIFLCEDHYTQLCDVIDKNKQGRDRDDTDQEKSSIAGYGRNSLTLKNWVGSIQTEDFSLEILPKLSLSGSDGTNPKETRTIFLHMLRAYVSKDRYIIFEDVDIERYKDMPLLEILICIFAKSVGALIQKGLAHAYIPYTDNLNCLKGKLDFAGQIRHNLVHKERFYVHYDQWSIDRPVNRVIKKALEVARRHTSNTDNYRHLTNLFPYFDEVQLAHNWRDEYSKVILQQNMQYYEQALDLARMILHDINPASWSGDNKTYAFLFPMEAVFESYVAAQLQAGMKEYNITLQESKERFRLMERQIKPDIVARPCANSEGKPLLILDTKWKKVDMEKGEPKIQQGDLYQLYSYGMRYQRAESEDKPVTVFLLYPKSGNFKKEKTFKEGDTRAGLSPLLLHIIPVDLSEVGKPGVSSPLQKTMNIIRDLLKHKKSLKHR